MGEAFLIQKGELVEPEPEWDGYYYKEGDEYVDITGGWLAGNTSGNGSQSKEVDHLNLKMSNNPSQRAGRRYYTSSKIDLSGIALLTVEWAMPSTTDTDIIFEILTAPNADPSENSPPERVAFYTERVASAFTRRNNILDASAITGEYHLAVRIRDGSTSVNRAGELRVYAVRGEE